MTPDPRLRDIREYAEIWYRARDHFEMRSAIQDLLSAVDTLTRERDEAREALTKVESAILSPPKELYPEQPSDEAIAKAIADKSPMWIAGYFFEHGLHVAMDWHLAAIRALKAKA